MNHRPVLLIIGGRGLIGEHLAKQASRDWDVRTASRMAYPADRKSILLDVCHRDQVREAIARARADLVAHLAAISDIDACEHEPRAAWEVNVEGTRNIASECASAGIPLVFISSAAVFDGEKHGYREEDLANPLSVYGRTKLEAERIVAAIVPQAIILRPSLVLGLGGGRHSNSLLNHWMSSWRQGRATPALTGEYRNPIDTGTLAEVILALGRNTEAAGIYHVGARDSASRYDLARETARLLGYPASFVERQAEPRNGRASRGRDHFLITERLRRICKVPLGVCFDVVRRSVSELAQSPIRTGV